MPLFSARHYEWLAAQLNKNVPSAKNWSDYEARCFFDDLVQKLAEELKIDNPKFNSAKFNRAVRQAHDDARNAALERASLPPIGPLARAPR